MMHFNICLDVSNSTPLLHSTTELNTNGTIGISIDPNTFFY